MIALEEEEEELKEYDQLQDPVTGDWIGRSCRRACIASGYQIRDTTTTPTIIVTDSLLTQDPPLSVMAAVPHNSKK